MPPSDTPIETVFLLSPAHCGAKRSQLLFNERAGFPLAVRLRHQGAPLGTVFSFLSGLYFRGKLAYARHFARHDAAHGGVLVITPGWGLISPERIITLDDMCAIAAVGVAPDEPSYREPLERDASVLARELDSGGRVILLGSIATGKYVDILERSLGERLLFPADFVGRGDMSRGGLMLRCAREDRELDYVPFAGAVRHGSRPPRLEPIR